MRIRIRPREQMRDKYGSSVEETLSACDTGSGLVSMESAKRVLHEKTWLRVNPRTEPVIDRLISCFTNTLNLTRSRTLS